MSHICGICLLVTIVTYQSTGYHYFFDKDTQKSASHLIYLEENKC
jgi:hypothetical protein